VNAGDTWHPAKAGPKLQNLVRLGLVALFVIAAAGTAAPAHAQDFDPRGHHRPRASPAPAGRTPSPSEGAQSAGASQATLIERYTHVVLTQPGEALPLERLAQLCRARDGSLKLVILDFETRAKQPGPDAYASTVALAGLYKLAGRLDDAMSAYQAAIALKPGDASTLLALARMFAEHGEVRLARARYEDALKVQTTPADKEQTLRTLMDIALDSADWDGAKAFHRQLMRLEPTNLFVSGELGRALYQRAEYVRAEEEFVRVAAAAAGDNRALASALKELGQAQAKAHESAKALATLQRALATSGPESALRAEIYEIIAGIYRADQKLPALIEQLVAEHPSDPARLALLGGLYEETGDGARAIDTYRRALARDPRQIDLRLRMIHLLQANGDLDKAITEYEALIRAMPNNPQFVFEACDALVQRGDRPRALRLVAELEARVANDEEALSHVAEFYARVGERDRSLKVLQRLAGMGAGDDGGHLVDLGDRYFQDGNTGLALQTWKRILITVQPRSKALEAMGDVLLEHDMTADAIAAYKEATELEPKNLAFEKALASAYERIHSYPAARALYESILKKATGAADQVLARDCRGRIVTLWSLERTLDRQLPDLQRRFRATPPDLNAGKMLAEGLIHLRRLPEAEAALRRIIAGWPGDSESYLALERVLVQEEHIADALVVLEALTQLDPKRAREIYERMAQYALQIYRDDDAVRYAVRAVELNPDDAEGHRRLGELYRSKQDVDHAIAELRAAITKNDRLFVVYFELADLLLAKGQTDDADRLFRAVVRSSPDQELIARAARLSMQIHLGKQTPGALEDDLLPLAIGNPQRPIYRRLLVELYGNLTFGLVQRVRHGSESEAHEAREALTRIGARAVKPLLDALADDDVSQQRTAIDVLPYVQNRHAALPLFTFATGHADLDLRTRAMLACGLLADGSLVDKYASLLFPSGSESPGADLGDSVGAAAVWGLAHMHTGLALPLLRRVAFGDGTPQMRALAVLGLASDGDAAALPRLIGLADSRDGSDVVRAAAIHALGDLNARSQAPALIEIAEDGDALARTMALLALAELAAAHDVAWEPEAVRAMADALFASPGDVAGGTSWNGAVPRAAAAALTFLATVHDTHDARTAATDGLSARELSPDVDHVLEGLVPSDKASADRAMALVKYADPIRRAAIAALQSSPDSARRVLDALGDGAGELAPFTEQGASGPAAQAARTLTAGLLPSIATLARDPDPQTRSRALAVLGRWSNDAAVDAVVGGLEDPVEDVRRVALASIGAQSLDGVAAPAIERAVQALGTILDSDRGDDAEHAERDWPMRVLAAQALGRLGRSDRAGAAAHLTAAIKGDRYALVREASLEALASFDTADAVPIARAAVVNDPEPRVREAAAKLAR
jgi:tetratricopeptide (TPR) repeat protein/HEAT repeat protein